MKTILIIEDDQRIATALSIRFKAQGYATWVAGDALAGINLAVRHRPDLILLDIALPGGNGFVLAEHFHTLPETRDTPILFATGSSDPELRSKVVAAGAAGLVRKPYQAETLLAVVEHVLQSHEQGGSRASAQSARSDCSKKRHGPKRLLIVEDDERVAMALAVRMQAAGFETTVANDGIAGIRSAVATQPDAVVLDISLPAGDGFLVAERILTNVPTRLPIIFLTASKRPDFRERAQQLGAAGFFEKPYDAEALVSALNEALR
jgi:DNA-binding response OmpR family regulator